MRDFHLLPAASLARSTVWRDHSARNSLADMLTNPATDIIVAHRGYVLISRGKLHRFAATHPTTFALDGVAVYLGVDGDTPVVGYELSTEARAQLDAILLQHGMGKAENMLDSPATGLGVEEPTWFHLRNIGLELNDTDAGLATTLVALGNWHSVHTHSPRNGQPTHPVSGGWVRTEPETGTEHFPRTDPAVIMAVIRVDDEGEENILLGNNALWPAGRYSLLAGFVEPGETLEAAVIREVKEEAGIHCHSPRYVGSQPWPFPCSLMLGFIAYTRDLDPVADEQEMSSVRWFRRGELKDGLARGEISVPGEISIAGQIIHMWLGDDERR